MGKKATGRRSAVSAAGARPAGVLRIDRVGIAVRDLEAARETFARAFGARFGEVYAVPGQNFRYAPFTMGGFTFEILSPTEGDSVIRRFLDKRGEGIHHLTFQVRDLSAAIAALKERGFQVAAHIRYPEGVLFEGVRWEEAFLHPKDTGGVLVHLAQKTPSKGRPATA